MPEERLRLDLSIARGLDYYTGTIYETFLLDLPEIGSVCSGGRYDNLAGLYTKQRLPGVGASLGLDRLLAAMEELNLLPKTATPAPVLMVQFSADRLGDYQKMARQLRAEGIGVEVYPEAKKVGQQFKYAEQRGFRVALIAGPDEFAQGVWKVKDLATREETTVAAAEVLERGAETAGRLSRDPSRVIAPDRSTETRCAWTAATTTKRPSRPTCNGTASATSPWTNAPGDARTNAGQEPRFHRLRRRRRPAGRGREGPAFPAGQPDKPRRVWECWSTRDDIDGLERWAELSGPGYHGLLVFVYHLLPNVELPDDAEDLWTWRGRRYLLRAVPSADYRRYMRIRSPKWDTVTLPHAVFRSLVRPLHHFTHCSSTPAEEHPV